MTFLEAAYKILKEKKPLKQKQLLRKFFESVLNKSMEREI